MDAVFIIVVIAIWAVTHWLVRAVARIGGVRMSGYVSPRRSARARTPLVYPALRADQAGEILMMIESLILIVVFLLALLVCVKPFGALLWRT